MASQGTSTAEQGHGARLQRWQDSQILTTCEEQAWKPLETRPHHVSGARGVAAPVPRTEQCRREWARKTKQAGMGFQSPDLQLVIRAWQTAGGQRAISLQSKKRQETSISRSRSPDTVYSTRSWRRQVRRNAPTGPDSPDSAQSVGAQQSQFVNEDIEILVSTQRQPGFRRSWKLLSCSTLKRRSTSLLRAQKPACTPQDQSNEKRVDDTVTMQTSSNSPS